MPICPRCENQVKATDLACGRCRLQLKAHGHPSIELHQTVGEEVLCTNCAYHIDDSCTFPQRPHAKSCTLYQPIGVEQERVAEMRSPSPSPSFKALWQRHKVWLILSAIFGVCLILTAL
jgi:hypothetical protein